MICCSIHCEKYNQCARTVPKSSVETVIYFDFMGGGTVNFETGEVKTYFWCGPNGDYGSFEPKQTSENGA